VRCVNATEPLTTTQRTILDLLGIDLPWPEHDEQ